MKTRENVFNDSGFMSISIVVSEKNRTFVCRKMIEKIKGIVLDTVRHNDRHDIVTVYTRERGRVPFIVASSATKAGRMRRARLQPLAVISADVNFSPRSEIQRLGSFNSEALWSELRSDPVKQAIAIFVTEFLGRLLRESAPDPLTWDFLERSVALLDVMERGVANFHIIFLSRLTRFLGIRPDTSGSHVAVCFDMRDGVYKRSAPVHSDVVAGRDLRWPAILARLDYVHAPYLRFNGASRRALLDGLLRYYAIHFPGLDKLKSPEVLSAIFR